MRAPRATMMIGAAYRAAPSSCRSAPLTSPCRGTTRASAAASAGTPQHRRTWRADSMASSHPVDRVPGGRGSLLFGALLLPVVLGACEVRPRHISAEPAEMSHAAFAPVGTESRVVYDGETLALPIGIEVVGEHLVLLDGAADSMITVLRRSDGALVRTFGRRGEGPGEYKGLWSVDAGDGLVPGRVGEKAAGPAAETDQTFWIYDVGLRRLTH